MSALAIFAAGAAFGAVTVVGITCLVGVWLWRREMGE